MSEPESLTDHVRRSRMPIDYTLCGECFTVTPDQEWIGLTMNDECRHVLAEPTEEPTFYRCPHCGFDHTDDDADPGVWSGYQWQMVKQRREILDGRDV